MKEVNKKSGILSEVIIHNLSNNLCCKWGCQIMKDWGAIVIQSGIQQQLSNKDSLKNKKFYYIRITDQITHNLHSKNKPINNHVLPFPIVVLRDVQMNGVHIAAVSGHLSTFGQQKNPFYPKNMVQIAGGVAIATRVCQEIIIKKNNKMTIQDIIAAKDLNASECIELSLVNIIKYHGAFNISGSINNLMSKQRGKNVLDGGAPFYSIYKCLDGHVAVGNLQPKFYQEMVSALKLQQKIHTFMSDNQFNEDCWTEIRTILSNKFKQKTASQWQNLMNNYDTCVTQVKGFTEAKIDSSFVHPNFIHPKL